MIYKIISRFPEKDLQESWRSGKPGIQHKKSIYTSKDKYDKYSYETIQRWVRCNFLVEIYTSEDGNSWNLIQKIYPPRTDI